MLFFHNLKNQREKNKKQQKEKILPFNIRIYCVPKLK